MVLSYQVGGKGVIQNVKMEQDFGTQIALITDEESETE